MPSGDGRLVLAERTSSGALSQRDTVLIFISFPTSASSDKINIRSQSNEDTSSFLNACALVTSKAERYLATLPASLHSEESNTFCTGVIQTSAVSLPIRKANLQLATQERPLLER